MIQVDFFHNIPHFSRPPHLVMCMGNPWVLFAVPVPVPIKTHTRACG
jgi:hypothetical protein